MVDAGHVSTQSSLSRHIPIVIDGIRRGLFVVGIIVPALGFAQRGAAVPVAPIGAQRDSVRPIQAKATPKAPEPAVAKPSARPDFKNLRFDEVWTRASHSPRWDDGIKAIPIAPQMTLTLDGQVRWREEFAQSFNFTNASDNYGQSRVLIAADLQAGKPRRLHGRVFAEFRDAQSYDRDLVGGTRANDADRSDMQNLFGDFAFAKSYVRYGRQEVATNRERLVGVPDWSNTRREFEGTRVMLVRGAFAFDALDARPLQVRLAKHDIGDTTTRFRVLSVGSASGAKAAFKALPATWQAYWYEQVISVATPTRRLTSGARAAWTVGSVSKTGQSYGFESEGAVQRGATGAKALHAWFWTTEASTQWRGSRGAPTLVVGLEEASGDRDANDARLEAFNTLYGGAHAHGGYADVFGRTNARQTHVISTWDPLRKMNLRGAWHRYDRLRLEDGVYNKQNTLLRPASGSRERHAGDEIDLTATLSATRHLKVIAGHAWVLPGAFLRDTPGGARSERWGFIGTAFTF